MPNDSPAAVLFDSAGNPVDVVLEGGTYKLSVLAKLLANTAVIGKVKLRNPGDTVDLGDAANPVRTDPVGTTTQPVSAASLPLPTGAATQSTLATLATEAKLETVRVLLDIIAADFATETTLNAVGAVLVAIRDTAGIKKITDQLPAGTNNIGDVDVVSSALPTGAATEATLALVKAKTDNLDVALSTRAAESTLASIKDTAGIKKITDPLPAGTNVLGGVTHAAGSQADGHSASIGATTDADTALTLIGRVKKLVSLLAGGLPASLVGGRLDSNIGAWLGSTVPTVGQKAMASSIPVAIASNQTAISVTVVPPSAVPGLSPGMVHLGGGTSGTVVVIRGTAYTEPSSGAQRSVSSSSASDASAGTGARSIEITYFQSTGEGPYAETVTLNGTTAVNTVATGICFIEKIVVLTAGSVGQNVGTITLHAATAGGGGTVGSIGTGTLASGVGDARTFWCHHYVPLSKTMALTGASVGISGVNGTGTFFLKAKHLAVANAAEVPVTGAIAVTAQFLRPWETPVRVVGPARVTMYAVPSTNGMTLNATIDYYEEAS